MKALSLAMSACVVGFAASAWGQTELPQPLSLPQALQHTLLVPQIQQAEAARLAAEAELLSAESIDGFRLTATGRARYIDTARFSIDQSHNDSSASITLRKRFYDFGFTQAMQDAAQSGVKASEHQMLAARQQSQLAVTLAFYNVLLADLEYSRDNEAMAIAFIDADRLKDRNELGQVSDVEMLRADAEFQAVRRKQVASASRRISSRARLALAMGRPGELVSDLIRPAIEVPDKQADDFEAYWAEVLAGNPQYLAAQVRREAAREKLAAARHQHGPVLSGEIDRTYWHRETGSTHPFSAGLMLEVPLFTGGVKDAALASAQAEVTKEDAALAQLRMDLRESAMQLWLERDNLRADIQAYKVAGDYRDLYLDRSRALYELEVKADLGDAMTETSEVRLQAARALFEWDLNQARLLALTGKLLEEQP